MRTPFFPIEDTTPETIEYLLDTVLMQTGSITFFTSKGRVSVDRMVDPHDSGWDTSVSFIVKLWRNPEHLKHSRSKFCGICTESIREVKDFVLNYRGENPMPRHKKAVRITEESNPVI